jgi:hypothetical protein
MRLVIHAGASKTGTSAFQAAMSEAYDLNREQGFLYPQAGRWLDGSHHELAFAVRPLPHLTSAISLEAILAELDREIVEASPKTVLLSSELFPYLLESKEFDAFVEAKFSEVVLGYVVRRQSEMLLSLYNQIVKDSVQAFTGTPFECFIANIRSLNFYEIIKRWRASGPDAVVLATYDENYLPGFLSRLGLPTVDAGDAGLPRVNVSLPHAWLDIVRMANARLGTMEARERFVGIIRGLDPPVCSGRSVLYSVAEQEAVDAFFEEGNRELARSLLGQDTLFSPADYRPVEAITQLPAEMVAQLAAKLAEGSE